MASAGRRQCKKSTQGLYAVPAQFIEMEKEYTHEGKQIGKAKAKKQQEASDEEIDELASEQDDRDDSGHSSAPKSRKKPKRKSASIKVQPKIRGTSPFDALSKEILVEICSLLDHQSLYRCAFLSKRFNKILFSNKRVIKDMWKAARSSNEALPLLSNFKERQFAILLYDHMCSVCGDDDGEADPWLRIVICKSCRHERLIHFKSVGSAYPEIIPRTLACCISTPRWVLKETLEAQAKRVLELDRQDMDDLEVERWQAVQDNRLITAYDDGIPRPGTGRKVTRFIKAREAVLGRFDDDTFNNSAVVLKGSAEIDDKAWEKLEPKLHKVIETGRRKRQQAAEQARHESRLAHLRRDVYDPARKDDDPHWPLFADFCRFESVKAIIDHDLETDELDKELMRGSTDAILAEAREWWRSLRLAVIKLIFTRTLVLDEDEELDDGEGAYEGCDEQWSSLATSAVCCDFADCSRNRKNFVFVGSLTQVLEHQHEVHSNEPKCAANMRRVEQGEQRQEEVYSNVWLPRPVSQAVQDIVCLGRLNADETTLDDLDGLFDPEEDAFELSWDNSPGSQQASGKRTADWRQIISRIKLEDDRAKTPLERPVITLYDNEGEVCRIRGGRPTPTGRA
ncbi:uncharacterized protein JCM15063_000886 [Sporobolomyces koalae]|uniref:uncharacterized protein n=1 Tax=Sporobolomyces koalae TaxID=500713 RepID=UPI00317F1EAB